MGASAMDKCREEFEKQRYWIGLFREAVDFDEELGRYVLNGQRKLYAFNLDSFNDKWAVWQKAWQHQQAKVEELENDVSIMLNSHKRMSAGLLQQQSMIEELIKERDELQKRVDELEEMFEIKWSNIQEADKWHSGNRIIYGDCAIGRFSIWWRTWKERDRPALEINDEFITEACDIEEAKQIAKSYLEQALNGDKK